MNEKKKPHGKDQVVSSLLKAAAGLFSEKGFDAVTLRMISDKAGVNHGLIHRHFGSKEILRRQTQEQLSANVRADIGEPEDLASTLLRASKAIRKHDKFWRVMARTLLDGKHKGEVQSSFPFVQKLLDLVEQEQENDRVTNSVEARSIVASFLAYGLGMLVFEKYILPAVGLDDTPSEEAIEKLNLELFSLFEK